MITQDFGCKAFVCEECKEELHYKDEVVFFLATVVVHVDESNPDWTHCLCNTCAEEGGHI